MLLPLTLVWKFTVYPDDLPAQGQVAVQQRVMEFFARQHFAVVPKTGEATHGNPIVEATSFGCRILVAESPAEGWGRDLTRLYATPVDSVFVVYGGKVYSEQPTWLSVWDILLSKFRRALGSKVQPSPVFTVIATKACQAERLPWTELR